LSLIAAFMVAGCAVEAAPEAGDGEAIGSAREAASWECAFDCWAVQDVQCRNAAGAALDACCAASNGNCTPACEATYQAAMAACDAAVPACQAACNGEVCQAPGANVLQNGSIEDTSGAFVDVIEGYMPLGAGSTTIPGWTVAPATTGQIVWARGPTGDGFTAADGTFFTDLTGLGASSSNGALQQSIALVGGVTYGVALDVSSYDNGNVSVTIGSHTVAMTPGASFLAHGEPWTPLTGTFTADPAEPTPIFKVMNTSPGSTIVFVDNFSVVCH
jgi:hypothetical protein